MDVVVYKRAKTVTGRRLVCVQPVFNKGASDTDQSLIGAGRSMVVENNYGYTGLSPRPSRARRRRRASSASTSTTPARAATRSGHSAERAPSVVPKLSLANGLVYTYTKPPRPERNRRVVLHRDRLPQGQDRVEAPRRQGPRLQQQLRAGQDRPGRQRLRRRARRPGDDSRPRAPDGADRAVRPVRRASAWCCTSGAAGRAAGGAASVRAPPRGRCSAAATAATRAAWTSRSAGGWSSATAARPSAR